MRSRAPDKAKAKSIVAAAEREMRFTLSLHPSPEAGPTILRNIYECFRMLGDALLISEGTESQRHEEQIARLLREKVVTRRPTATLQILRRIRHDITYRGYVPTMMELHDALDLSDACFAPLKGSVQNRLRRLSDNFSLFPIFFLSL